MNRIELPPLTEEQQLVSQRFTELLSADIKKHGAIPFSEYMHRSLYEPGLGYYVNGFSKFGERGDFTTAPEISDDFAFCLANQCAQVFDQIDHAEILELGGGSGKLAVDILSALTKLEQLPQRYMILDVSAELQLQQQDYVSQHLPESIAKLVQWQAVLPDEFTGVVIANEVLDAFAVERFIIEPSGVMRVMVDHSDEGFFLATVQDQTLSAEVASIEHDIGTTFALGYRSELCRTLDPWWSSIAAMLQSGAVFICDYGAERRRYYAPTKSDGTLRCFYRHGVHNEPFAFPAVRDITADVDFTAVAISATNAGLELQGYSPLSEFMLSLDVLDRYQQQIDSLSEKQQLAKTSDLKKIILPQEMGDRFMVIGFSQGVDLALRGFSRADWSRLL